MPILEGSLDLPLKQVIAVLQDRTMHRTTYFGVPTQKVPLDLWVYQEIIVEQKPDVIVEIGTRFGGSALYMAHLCDLIGHGEVVSVDIQFDPIHAAVRKHPRICLVTGAAADPATVKTVEQLIAGLCSAGAATGRVMVIEDSAHTYDNTLAVLRAYNRFVNVGSYFIVEDGIIGHGIDWSADPYKTPPERHGPYAAVQTFLAENKDFIADRWREDFLITWNPCGYLRRRS